jgi:hypothetical protein
MPPKRKDNEDKEDKHKCRKKAKKEPSGDEEAGELEAGAAGSQQPSKGDLNKMYSAMQYEKKKNGNGKPLETYQALQTSKEKHNFWRSFLSDKKFTWLTVQENYTHTTSTKDVHIEGWLSKYQVADAEKLPLESELLQDLLADLPCRAHRTASWAAKGEKEYYYQAQSQTSVSSNEEHQLMASRQGKISHVSFDQLTEAGHGPERPSLALEDEKKVKTEPEEQQGAMTAKNYQETQMKLKKLSKQMGYLAHEALVYKTKLQERVDQGKTYLQPILELLIQQVTIFQDATNTAIGHSATGGEATAAAVAALEKQFQEANTHYQAFKSGAYKDVLGIFK